MSKTKGFEAFGLDERLLSAIKDLKFERPTPIQAEGIPHVMEGKDVVGLAQTGTGKTAAFLLPVLHRMLQHKRRAGTLRVLVLCPTRELVVQIEEHFRPLAKNTPFRAGTVFGGVRFQPQIRALRGGAEVIVATPGRLIDHIGRGNARLGSLETLVLDEADRMLDMGFLPDIRKILRKMPVERQTLLFSATMPPPIFSLTSQFMNHPVEVSVAPPCSVPEAIDEKLYPVNRQQKADLLVELLKRTHRTSVLVFTGMKDRAQLVETQLRKAGYKTGSLHGDLKQYDRTRALQGFRKGKIEILVATDIAARGLDIEDISHVVNFDVPQDPESYIHRIGRTARAEADGSAMTLVSPEEEEFLERIEGLLGRKIQREKLNDFPYEKPTLVLRRGGGFVGGPSSKRTGLGIWPKNFGKSRRRRR